MNFFLIALGVGAWMYFRQGKEFIAQYKIKFIDALFNYAKTRDSLFTKIHFSIRVEVDNPTDFAGTMQSAKLKLSYKDKVLGTVEKREPVTIAKNAKTKVEIPVTVPTLSLIGNIATLISAITSGKNIVFNIKGDLIFTIGTVTVNENYPVKLSA